MSSTGEIRSHSISVDSLVSYISADTILHPEKWDSQCRATTIKESKKMRIIDKDNRREIYYNVLGASHYNIKVEPEWINKSKDLYLSVHGEWKLEYSEDKETISTKIHVDTDIYEKWDYEVLNGILKVTLFEKINLQPEFPRI